MSERRVRTSKSVYFTSREFNQDTSGAKRAAESGPVYITDRGKPAHVLLTIEHYRRLTAQPRSVIDALSFEGLSDIELELPALRDLPRAADLP